MESRINFNILNNIFIIKIATSDKKSESKLKETKLKNSTNINLDFSLTQTSLYRRNSAETITKDDESSHRKKSPKYRYDKVTYLDFNWLF